jgi:hypothetical protein
MSWVITHAISAVKSETPHHKLAVSRNNGGAYGFGEYLTPRP